MPWLPLIGIYLAAMVLMTWRSRSLLAGNGRALARTLAVGTLLLALGEIIGEERELWSITHGSGLLVFKAPIEGAALVLATLLNCLLPYLMLKAREKP